jgi:hypothetical protein
MVRPVSLENRLPSDNSSPCGGESLTHVPEPSRQMPTTYNAAMRAAKKLKLVTIDDYLAGEL